MTTSGLPADARWDRRAYLRLRGLRDRIVRAAIAPLARLGVAPWAVSVAGVLLAISTIWTLRSHPAWALAALLTALLCDALDGALARTLGRCGPRGKLVDHACDTATLGALVVALAVTGLAPPGRSAAAITLTLLSLGAAVLYRLRGGQRGESLLEGGFFVHLPKGLLYGAVVLFLLGGPQRFALTLSVFNLLSVAATVGYLLATPARRLG